MTMPSPTFEPGDRVRHPRLGTGEAILDRGATVLVDFRGDLQSCARGDLVRLLTPIQMAAEPEWHAPLRVITRCQAEAIRSANDTWGVFSRSRIALLPHQLWVCKRVLEQWPARWLVADDVGLGKTIEAGLILWPLLARGTVRRFLLLCPASLVGQWQSRLRDMFDIRITAYTTDSDTKHADFWNSHNQVVASLQTMRTEKGGRQDRLRDSEPWDLLLVDEAHHLNADEERGPTLGFKLVRELLDRQLVASAVFFTGTPHRGKEFGFISLMSLLRPDLFDPGKPAARQLPSLNLAMIRNNKQQATDMQGNRLFTAPNVTPETYQYSPSEARFYEMLTEFILSGKAYASSLSAADQRMVMLILIAMQKIASSSVAAIRRALRRRLNRFESAHSGNDARLSAADRRELEEYAELDDDDDGRNNREEGVIAKVLQLVEGEEGRLRELLAAADDVEEETRISRILEIIDERFDGRSVLLFTEYKATQSLLMSELLRKYGDGCASFINGDGVAEEVLGAGGTSTSIRLDREDAADRFNRGEVRFLISTEAGGEGIDLQERCHSLIHVDLPWNPMRLHQRVGRLNRYGQTKQVDVVHLRNPDTVEGRIWGKLLEKIDSIQSAFDPVMDEPEDLMQLVLGMTSPALFNEMFSEADRVPGTQFSTWWDQKAARFGGQDAVEAVRNLVGHAAKFDYQEASKQIPRVDLPTLEPFFRTMLSLNGRQVREDDGLSFKTPDEWRDELGVRLDYEGLHFDRQARGREAAERVVGVGHKVLDRAIREATENLACLASLPAVALSRPLVVFSVADSVTTGGALVRSVVVGVEATNVEGARFRLLRDWELLERLNLLAEGRGFRRATASPRASDIAPFVSMVEDCRTFLEGSLPALQLSYAVPAVALLAVLWPTAEGPAA